MRNGGNSMFNKKTLYPILGVYAVLVNYFFNHNLFFAFITWIYWPIYLFYKVLTGDLDNGVWLQVINYYF